VVSTICTLRIKSLSVGGVDLESLVFRRRPGIFEK
jgi:hypothetical protein